VASVHEGKKPFKCSICGTRFARKTHLNAHLQQLIKNRILSKLEKPSVLVPKQKEIQIFKLD
jgi:uncharacterized Zn-finger protein